MKRLLLAWTLALPLFAAETFYNVIDLGTLGGWQSESDHVNNHSQVVGYSHRTTDVDDDEGFSGFLWSNSNMTLLGDLGGGAKGFTHGLGINDSKWVVGYSENADGKLRPFLWKNGNMTDLGTLGGVSGRAKAINNAGHIVGSTVITSGEAHHATLWRGGNIIDLGTLGGTSSGSSDISERGEITGNFRVGENPSRGYFRRELPSGQVEMTDIGTLGGIETMAMAINDRSQIIGMSRLANNAKRAFLWEPKKPMKDLGTLGGDSFGFDINQVGQIVGRSQGPGGYHGFIHNNGVMSDLNTLVGENSGWFGLVANSINDRGEIACNGHRNNRYHACLMIPKVKLTSFTLDASEVPGGKPVRAEIQLSGNAPPGGATIQLDSTNPDLSIPQQVIVAAGQDRLIVHFPTLQTKLIHEGVVRATYQGVTKSRDLKIRPIYIETLKVFPNPVIGVIRTVTLTPTLEIAPTRFAVSVTTTSNKPGAANVPNIPTSFGIGVKSVGVHVTVRAVSATTHASLRASANSQTKSVDLELRP